MITSGLMSSLTDMWATPQELFDELNGEFRFTLDPCATKDNAKCARFYTKERDGLLESWVGERVFMNPPYGRVIGEWVKKAAMGGQRYALGCSQHGRIPNGFTTTFTAKQKLDLSEEG